MILVKLCNRADRRYDWDRRANHMDAEEIIVAIKKRRDDCWDRQIDSEADFARAMADEYDQLLIEIGAITPEEAKSA